MGLFQDLTIGLRRTRSSPTLTVSKDKSSIKLDVKVEYSLDLRLVLSDFIASFKMTSLLQRIDLV